MPGQAKRFQTHRAAQFYVAAELTRRGNLVTLTRVNPQKTDLLAVSPKGQKYRVEVKGLASSNFWLIRDSVLQDDLFFILVYLPQGSTYPKFFVLTSAELSIEMDKIKQNVLARGREYTILEEGLNFKQPFDYENHWDSLPE